MVVRAGANQVQRDPVTVAGHGALGALFAPVHRAAPGHLTTQGDSGEKLWAEIVKAVRTFDGIDELSSDAMLRAPAGTSLTPELANRIDR